MEIAYWTIIRRGQMEHLRNMDEDEWPEPFELADYEPKYKADPDFYHPKDYIVELGAFLRDDSIRKRKERVEKKREAEQANRMQRPMF